MPKASVRLPEEEELRRITRRAVAEIIPQAEFVEALRSGRCLRLKMGFDPTRPVITLGWAVGLRKLRQLQELGHQVVLIIGDWTAQIGDPSGQSQTRAMLTADEVKANAETILRQFYRILDEKRTEVRWQSEWFASFTLADVVRLAAKFTVAQMLQRDDFAQRFQAHKPVGVHELIYPLLQAYDSIAVQADVEFGGTDQKFNILVGRELQATMGLRPQSAFLVPLLVGLDGRQKMSQSLGNYIAIEDPPHDMYGKIMSLPDAAMLDYFELLTDVLDEELAEIREALAKRSVNPMEVKMRLAREIVGQFHSPQAAQEAEEDFDAKFRTRIPKDVNFLVDLMPEGVAEVTVSLSNSSELHSLPHLIREARAGPRPLASSVREARTLIKQGAVERIGRVLGEAISKEPPERIHKFWVTLRDGDVFRIGKHGFLRIVDADKG